MDSGITTYDIILDAVPSFDHCDTSWLKHSSRSREPPGMAIQASAQQKWEFDCAVCEDTQSGVETMIMDCLDIRAHYLLDIGEIYTLI